MVKSKKTTSLEKMKGVVKKSLFLGKTSVLLLKPLSKKDKLKISRLKKTLSESDIKKIQKYLKQGKAKLRIKKIGLSFMVANSDLRPDLESSYSEVTKLNKKITNKFESELERAFSSRAWHMIQEHVGMNVLGLRNVKKILTLVLFCDGVKINFKKIPNPEINILKNNAKKIGSIEGVKFNSRAKRFDFVIKGEPFDYNKFVEMAEKIISGEKHKPNKNDLEFISNYLKKGIKINPSMPPDLAEKVKNFVVNLKKREKEVPYKVTQNTIHAILSLLGASARLELREDIQSKDLNRVFKLIIKKPKIEIKSKNVSKKSKKKKGKKKSKKS